MTVQEKVAIAGSGAIACGLAATVAARGGDVVVLARKAESAKRAREQTAKLLDRMDANDASVEIVSDIEALSGATLAVEAIVEEIEPKAVLLGRLHGILGEDGILASTTSSLPVNEMASVSGRPTRFAGLHVFNPVPRMDLVELIYPENVDADVPERMRTLCAQLGKTSVEVPDVPGFVVNRLLFPYLFDAVRLLDETGLTPEAVDSCMKMGAGHPMGPLALLDLVGLDVGIAIGERIGAQIPWRLREMAAAGQLGRKAGQGFYSY